MRVHFSFLRFQDTLRGLLITDGWKFEPDQDQTHHAKHVLVRDESAARTRLDRLGLLTSAHLRIEFDGMHFKNRMVNSVPLAH